MKNVFIGASVTAIPERAFHDCENLESLSLGNAVASIGNRAFRNCYSLTEIRYHGTKNQWSRIRLGTAWNDGAELERIKCDDGDTMP
jgi:hypothetical protein